MATPKVDEYKIRKIGWKLSGGMELCSSCHEWKLCTITPRGDFICQSCSNFNLLMSLLKNMPSKDTSLARWSLGIDEILESKE